MDVNMKILFTDLDGTLLNDKKEITPFTRQALDKWHRAGHRLVLCSGRPLPSILEVKDSLFPDDADMYLIGFNGGLIYDCAQKRVISRTSLPLSLTAEILRSADACGIHCHTYGDECILTPADTVHLAFYRKTIHMPFHVVENLPDALLNGSLSSLPDLGAVLTEGPCKCLAIETLRPSRLEKLRKLLEKNYGTQLQLLYSSKYLLEIFPTSSGKGTALQRLSGLLGIPLADTVAAGDQSNDISMLEAAGTSIAMSNGVEDVKKAATMVTAYDNNNDGLGKLLTELL